MIFHLAHAPMPAGYGEALLPLAAAKAHLGVLADDDDDLIAALRDAAIDMVEQYTGQKLRTRTEMVWQAEGFADRINLGVRPVSAVTEITWLDSTGVAQTMDAATVRLLPHGEIAPAIGSNWPSDVGGGVQITFTAGMANGAVPPTLIHAAKMFLADLYMNRETVVVGTITAEIPHGFKMLCAPHRLLKV